MVKFIKGCIEKVEGEYEIIFSAHGLPQSFVDAGDPYPIQVEKSVDLIMKSFSADFKIAYQSKLGPAKWLEPSLISVAQNLTVKTAVLVPISFVSENIETLYELDIELKEITDKKGVNLIRVPCFNDSPEYIELLRTLVIENS